ncbi:MAG TPA: hypothetical protein VFJ15_01425 [Oleiagrimonas sp.]|nr:hypothetical protein [Oleiagrimonas sp.]
MKKAALSLAAWNGFQILMNTFTSPPAASESRKTKNTGWRSECS